MILILLVLVILVYLQVTDTTRFKPAFTKSAGVAAQAAQKVDATDILKARYARGEIDKATYEAMLREIA